VRVDKIGYKIAFFIEPNFPSNKVEGEIIME
jgi:hypothetical protein